MRSRHFFWPEGTRPCDPLRRHISTAISGRSPYRLTLRRRADPCPSLTAPTRCGRREPRADGNRSRQSRPPPPRSETKPEAPGLDAGVLKDRAVWTLGGRDRKDDRADTQGSRATRGGQANAPLRPVEQRLIRLPEHINDTLEPTTTIACEQIEDQLGVRLEACIQAGRLLAPIPSSPRPEPAGSDTSPG